MTSRPRKENTSMNPNHDARRVAAVTSHCVQPMIKPNGDANTLTKFKSSERNVFLPITGKRQCFMEFHTYVPSEVIMNIFFLSCRIFVFFCALEIVLFG
jgi:hypothetical protein